MASAAPWAENIKMPRKAHRLLSLPEPPDQGTGPQAPAFPSSKEMKNKTNAKKKNQKTKTKPPNYAVFNFAFPLIPIYQVSFFKIGREVKLRW